MAVIAERVNKAKSVVAFPAFTISRLGLQKQAQKAVEAIGVLLPLRSWKSAS
jgi:indolepyruvate decarboxylase